MNKQEEFNNMSSQQPHPSAPPSYNEAMQKQPAYNPSAPAGYYPDMTMQHHQQAAPAMHQPQYPPQHQQYAPQPMAPATVVYTTAAPTLALAVGPRPATIACPHCHKRVTTTISSEAQKTAHIAALVLCLIGCWFCCCIPYCMSSFQDVHHKCPECRTFIGTYKH